MEKSFNQNQDKNSQKNRLILAVTGSMAAGKNYVSNLLEKKGFLAIDADKCVHQAIEEAKNQILEAFLPIAKEKNIQIQNPEGTINRKNLGSILFSDEKLLQKQESIVHPKVNEIFNHFIDENPEKNIVLNATVLYKTPVINRCDAIIFVKAPIITRFFRAKRRDNLPSREIFKRFASQFKIFAKYKFLKSDIYIIWNIGKSNKLEKKLDKILKSIKTTISQ
ncbi:MAG: dephospho-CoA kinase [Spirochaetaceae bacterium]|nr:dephospho-CoA kinase [Spirochaetaceae bacterium]